MDHQVQKARLVQLETLVQKASLERRAHQVLLVKMVSQVNRDHLVGTVRKELQGKKDRPAKMDALDLEVLLGHLELRVRRVPLVKQALRVNLACKDHLVLLALLGKMEKQVRRVHLVSQGQQVLMEKLAEPESLVNKETMVHLDHQGHQARKGHLAMLVVQELQDRQDHLVQKVQKASLE